MNSTDFFQVGFKADFDVFETRQKIISSIAEMRNAEGDAHGVGARRIGVADYHARLFVNSATTVADFILSVATKKNSTKE